MDSFDPSQYFDLHFNMKLFLLLSFLAHSWSLEGDIGQTRLHGGQEFPLVGLGVGNLQHDLIESHVANGMDLGYRLVDTAHASKNEHLIANGVKEGLIANPDAEMHVVTKVWYTYLGYERTKISVRESLEQLNNPNIRVHMLLHWPRCRDDIPWMKCEEEETALPQAVKDAGPAPHLDRENAFKESWRALEDIFLGKISLGEGLPEVVSIGVSNFDLDDLKALAEGARVVPHILQDNVWSLAFNPYLMEYCKEKNIHFEAYNVMNGILGNRDAAPFADDALGDVVQRYNDDPDEGDEGDMTHAQVILKWLTQNDISVIPRTTQREHLNGNSPKVIESIPDLDEEEERIVETAVAALLRGVDLEPPEVSFVNKHDSILHIFWWDEDEEEEVLVKEGLKPGQTWNTSTFSGHVFLVYDESDYKKSREFTIEAGFGERDEIHIDGLDEL